jgi:hypothetical protein
MPSRDERRETLTLAFEDAGREITQAFSTLSGNLTLAAGTLGALLAVIGAGELFGQQSVIVNVEATTVRAKVPRQATIEGLPELSNVSLLLLAVALPLIGRFFVRATIGYQQLLRFNKVRTACWRYLSGDLDWPTAKAHVDIYVTRWRSPQRLRTLLWGSAKYGFVWLFIIYALVLGWAFYTASGFVPRLVAGALIGLWVLFEAFTLVKSSYFTPPDDNEAASLRDGGGPGGQNGNGEAHNVEPPPNSGTQPIVTEESGPFIGRRTLRRLSTP